MVVGGLVFCGKIFEKECFCLSSTYAVLVLDHGSRGGELVVDVGKAEAAFAEKLKLLVSKNVNRYDVDWIIRFSHHHILK